MSPSVDVTHQFVVIARLGDFCRFSFATARYESDPWLYMRTKLREIEPALRALKEQQLAATKERLRAALAQGVPSEEALTDFRSELDRFLAPGDYVDIAFQLNAQDLADAARRKAVAAQLAGAKAHSLFDEERKPEEARSKAYGKVVTELNARLGLDLLEKALTRKPRTARRKRMVLRRLRGNVAEYCSVLHVPLTPEDTFSPFMLNRVEALAIACLRFLDRHR